MQHGETHKTKQMGETVKKISLQSGKTLEIYQTQVQSPREDDNLGTMVCFHGGYNLGDEHDYVQEDFNSFDELKEQIVKDINPLVILPLYLFDHSGITISTTPFSCKWDSGQVGWIFIDKKQLDILGTHMLDTEAFPEYKERLKNQLAGEVKTYDYYISGDTYGFQIMDEEGEYEDGCSGFFGTDWKTNGLTDNADLSEEDLGKL